MKLNIDEDSTIINGEYIIYHNKPYISHDVHTGKKQTPDFIYNIMSELKEFIKVIK